MNNIFLCCCILIITMGCSSKAPILSKEEYMDIVLDLQLAETAISNSASRNKDSLRKIYQARICEIYGYKDIQKLKESLKPLETDSELMLEIIKMMNSKLDKMADSVLTKPDSLQ